MKKLIPLLLLAGMVVFGVGSASAQRVSYPKGAPITWASANGGSDSTSANTAPLTTSSAPLVSAAISTTGWDWGTSAVNTTAYAVARAFLAQNGTSASGTDSLYYAWECSADGSNFNIVPSSSATGYIVLVSDVDNTMSIPLLVDGDAVNITGTCYRAPFIRLKLWGDVTGRHVAIRGTVQHDEIVSP